MVQPSWELPKRSTLRWARRVGAPKLPRLPHVMGAEGLGGTELLGAGPKPTETRNRPSVTNQREQPSPHHVPFWEQGHGPGRTPPPKTPAAGRERCGAGPGLRAPPAGCLLRPLPLPLPLPSLATFFPPFLYPFIFPFSFSLFSLCPHFPCSLLFSLFLYPLFPIFSLFFPFPFSYLPYFPIYLTFPFSYFTFSIFSHFPFTCLPYFPLIFSFPYFPFSLFSLFPIFPSPYLPYFPFFLFPLFSLFPISPILHFSVSIPFFPSFLFFPPFSLPFHSLFLSLFLSLSLPFFLPYSLFPSLLLLSSPLRRAFGSTL